MLKLNFQARGRDTSPLSSEDMSLLEVVVPGGAFSDEALNRVLRQLLVEVAATDLRGSAVH